MPEMQLATMPAAISAPIAAFPTGKGKDDIAKYADIIRELSQFANSEVGKQLVGRILPGLGAPPGPNGFVAAQQGEHKRMPVEEPITSPFYNGGAVGPKRDTKPQVVVEYVSGELSGAEQYDLFVSGLLRVQQQLGETKTLKETLEWINQMKPLIISQTPPLRVEPKRK